MGKMERVHLSIRTRTFRLVVDIVDMVDMAESIWSIWSMSSIWSIWPIPSIWLNSHIDHPNLFESLKIDMEIISSKQADRFEIDMADMENKTTNLREIDMVGICDRGDIPQSRNKRLSEPGFGYSTSFRYNRFRGYWVSSISRLQKRAVARNHGA